MSINGYATNLKKTSIQLMWLDQFEFAGFYIAKEKGFYEKAGLDVEIKKYKTDLDLTQTILDGKSDFGLNSSSLLIDKSNGKDITILGTIFQSSPLVLIALQNSNIKTFSDIKNKKIMIATNQENFATFQSMLKNQGLNINELNFIPHTFKVNDLIDGKADLMSAYMTNELFELKHKGYEAKIFNPKDYGFDFYEDIMFTSKTFAQNNPQLVKDFYTATVKGWEYAFENIEESAKIIYEKYNTQNKSLDALIYEANEMKKLVYDKEGKFGTITEERINIIANIYRVMGLINNKVDINDLIYTKHLENELSLTEEEKNYLINKSNIKMCVNPDLMPLEKIENDVYLGISADYIKLLQEKIKTPIVLISTKSWNESLEKAKKRECDFIPLMMKNSESENYFDFTKSYMKIPLVVASKIDAPFIENIEQINQQALAIVKDYGFAEILKAKYPNIKFVEVSSINDGLKLVEKGKVFGFVDTLSTLGYQIQNNYVGQLKISAKFNDSIELSIATRNDESVLNSIFSKAIDDIPSYVKQKVLNNWVNVNYQKEINYSAINKILLSIIGMILVFALIYRQYLLKKLNRRLEERIEEEIKKNDEKNRILVQQSRMASMGEMLENIAHQWRQPLSTISVCASGMEVKKEIGVLDDDDFYKSINHIKQATNYLSNTIDDFRNFFSKDKVIAKINIEHLIDKSLELVAPTFDKHKIICIKQINAIEFLSLENELIQVIMNILVNAKDALKDNVSLENERYILIDIKVENKNLVIRIKDNANGISEDIIDKIFEPYFTTKHKSKGTGIGLYMSKLLIEKHLKGHISVDNVKFKIENKSFQGAQFKISLPLELLDE